MIPAPFLSRLLAFLIDNFLISILWGLTPFPEKDWRVWTGESIGINIGLFFLFSTLYFTILEASAWRGTVGKKLFGLEVRKADHTPLTFSSSLLRNSCRILTMAPAYLGYLLPLIDKQKRALHDMVCGTMVFQK